MIDNIYQKRIYLKILLIQTSKIKCDTNLDTTNLKGINITIEQ